MEIAKREVDIDVASRIDIVRYYKSPRNIPTLSLTIRLSSGDARLVTIIRRSRFCLICPSTRITRPRSSSPRWDFPYLGANTWRLCDSAASPPTHVSAREKDSPSMLWSCRGKSEAITLGFYPGLPTRRGSGSVANKRVKRRATVEWRALRLQRIKRRLRLFYRPAASFSDHLPLCPARGTPERSEYIYTVDFPRGEAWSGSNPIYLTRIDSDWWQRSPHWLSLWLRFVRETRLKAFITVTVWLMGCPAGPSIAARSIDIVYRCPRPSNFRQRYSDSDRGFLFGLRHYCLIRMLQIRKL